MRKINSPDDPDLVELCVRLTELGAAMDHDGGWPEEQLELCGAAGVFEWFLPVSWGGQGWSDVDIVRGYLKLSAACLTTTFIITQRTGACRRLVASDNETAKQRWLPKLLTSEAFATLGISHLTTSRRHLSRQVMRAEQVEGGFLLNGFSPWVTGSPHADMVLTGATLDDGRQILVALPSAEAGVSMPPPEKLVGLGASQTSEVRCQRVHVGDDMVLAGPVENIMQQGIGAKTGGLQTSTLAAGLADAAILLIERESGGRAELVDSAAALRAQWQRLRSDLIGTAEGRDVCSTEELRTRANSLVLRAAQAALAASKGIGYLVWHPAGRWCREALFFLVWSCPQPVMAANLCELAGIEG